MGINVGDVIQFKTKEATLHLVIRGVAMYNGRTVAAVTEEGTPDFDIVYLYVDTTEDGGISLRNIDGDGFAVVRELFSYLRK